MYKIVLLIIIVLTFDNSCAIAEKSTKQIVINNDFFTNIFKSLVKIRVYKGREYDTETNTIMSNYEYGSGWIYSKSGYIIAANHTLSNRETGCKDCISVMFYDEPGKYLNAMILSENKDYDFAILKTAKDNIQYYDKIYSKNISEYKGYVIAAGFPNGNSNLFNATFVSGLIIDPNAELSGSKKMKSRSGVMTFSSPTYKGFSGGPLFTSNGKIIGITLGANEVADEWNSFSYALPIKKVEDAYFEQNK